MQETVLTVGALLADLVRGEIRHRETVRPRPRVLVICCGQLPKLEETISPESAIELAWAAFRAGDFDLIVDGRRLVSLDEELCYGPSSDVIVLPRVVVRPR
ncbi:hypothetical protein EON81_09135 [bacterium]|nr:MAG: hypothetical protein EON81_09135 [bacterium]